MADETYQLVSAEMCVGQLTVEPLLLRLHRMAQTQCVLKAISVCDGSSTLKMTFKIVTHMCIHRDVYDVFWFFFFCFFHA